jgi:hypothetical protein
MTMNHLVAGALIPAFLCAVLGAVAYFLGGYFGSKLFGATPPATLGARMRALVSLRSPLAFFAASSLGLGWLLFICAVALALVAAFLWGVGLQG